MVSSKPVLSGLEYWYQVQENNIAFDPFWKTVPGFYVSTIFLNCM